MKTPMAYFLIVAGLILLVSGVFMLRSNGERAPITVQTQDNENLSPNKKASNAKVSTDDRDAGLTESEKKGKEFVSYIVKRFESKNDFRVIQWQGDNGIDGIYPEANQYPDLEIRFTLKGQQDVFAVECKWRKGLFNGKLQWGKDYQLDQYVKFSKEKNLPVFIVIGVGGSPDNPKFLYIIPLNKIKSHILDHSDIKQYLKTDEREFYWNLEDKTLS